MTPLRITEVGEFGRATQHGTSFDLDGPHAQLRIEACAPQVVRIRIARHGAPRDIGQSFAVVDRHPASPHVHGNAEDHRTEVNLEGLSVTVEHEPLRITVRDADGRALTVDHPERGTVVHGEGHMEAHLKLEIGERVFGLGEQNGPHDHRGPRFQGSSHVLWNTDHFAHDSGSDPVYAGVPLLLFLRDGRCHGLLVDEPGRLHVDIGHTDPEVLSLRARHGVLDRYVLAGPTPQDVLRQYARLTGRPPMPPRWALGLHQCRYSYETDGEVRWIASTFRQKAIPCDALWLDIHHLEGFRPLVWDHARFPDPARLCADLREDGFRVVTIVDPHIAADDEDPTCRSGREDGHFVTWPDGAEYRAPVWPSRGPKPTDSVFPDFTRASTRDWWGDQIRPLLDAGIAGIWNDMNEPAVFDRLDGTFPPEIAHDGDAGRVRHEEVHNAYGALMAEATFAGLARHRPAERPFVLTRSTWAGGQRASFCWTGDVRSEWTALRQSIVTLLSMSVSGLPFVGSDVGGFVGEPSAELFTRWLQAMALSPFLRIHTDLDTRDQEPWSYGALAEESNRRAIELRYEFIPYLEAVARECHETGLPMIRPMWFEFPEHGPLWSCEDQFLVGDQLLVAPVLYEGAAQRTIHVPPGRWYELDTARCHEGPTSITLPVDRDSLPVLCREGSILLRQPAVMHTGATEGVPRFVDVYPSDRSKSQLVDDDGISANGPNAVRSLLQERDAAHISLSIGARRGDYTPPARSLVVRFHGAGSVARVRVGRHVVSKENGAEGPHYVEGPCGRIDVHLDETPEAVKVTLDLETHGGTES
jgi:alpha-glucosidase